MARTRVKLEPFDYVLEEEIDKQAVEQTVFHLRPLTPPEMVRMEKLVKVTYTRDKRTREDVATIDGSPTEKAQEILKLGLLGWDNLHDEKGSPILYSDLTEDERLVAVSPWLEELAEAVLSGSTVDAEQRKNS